eukprot:TRINITY_DN3396_c1_g2_i1.p1 TRINITY_DN3396_c1_g2~~TRINITY_DN3396_c1_g2_i1.p1  ORF type:complete len:726 (+),score=155.50 TRINITY_DN3396_c1_g2_i1:223-2178(+)
MVVGEDRVVSEAEPCQIYNVCDVMGVVFSFLPLAMVRVRCAIVCSEWHEMLDIATQQHSQRYVVNGTYIFDVLHQERVSLSEELKIDPSQVVFCKVYESDMYIVSTSSDPSSIPDDDLEDEEAHAAADANLLWELGIHDLSDAEIRSILHKPVRHYRLDNQPFVDAQHGYEITLVKIFQRTPTWHKVRGQFDGRLPLLSVEACSKGLVLAFPNKITMFCKKNGAVLHELTRMSEGLFSPPFYTPDERFVLVTQGDKLHVVSLEDGTPTITRTLPIGFEALSVERYLKSDDCYRVIIRAIDCLKLVKITPAKKSVATIQEYRLGTEFLHLSETNVLSLNSNGDAMLEDVEGCHFSMGFPGHKGRVVSLLESGPPDYFAEGVFVHTEVDDTLTVRHGFRAAFMQQENMRNKEKRHISPEEWADMSLTDTIHTHPFATNQSKYPTAPKWDEIQAIRAAAPHTTTRFDSSLPMNCPENLEARRYASFISEVERREEESMQAFLEDTKFSTIVLSSIARQTHATHDSIETHYEVQRTLADVFSIKIPFEFTAYADNSRLRFCRTPKVLYIALLDPPRVGVFAVSITCGFLKWRRTWEQENCTNITLDIVGAVVLFGHHSDEDRYVTVIGQDGAIRHTDKISGTGRTVATDMDTDED